MMDIAEVIQQACELRPGVDVDDGTGLSIVVMDEAEHFDDDDVCTDEDFERMKEVFEASVRDLTAHLGKPDFLGEPLPYDDFPGFHGDTIAVWRNHTPPLYASLWWPDKEMPIYVFLAQVPEAA